MKKRLSWFSLLIVAVGGLLVTFAGSMAKGIGLPKVPDVKGLDTGLKDPVTSLFKKPEFTLEDEYYLGRLTAAKILAHQRGALVGGASDPTYRDAAANDYVRHVGEALRMHSERPELFAGYSFMILDSKEINAVATPGGHVFVTRGLLQTCDSEDVLAAALAHEIAHVTLRHGMESITRSESIANYKKLVSMGMEEMGGHSASEVVDAINSPVAGMTQTLVEKGFSRDQEKKADEEAIKILGRAGYDPHGMLRLFGNLKDSPLTGKLDFAKDHPDIQERRKNVEQLVANEPAAPASDVRQHRFEKARASF